MTESSGGSTELWLVRHGETEWSASGRHTSRTDVPLTERGRAAAVALKERLAGIPFARVLTSPLARARDTCALAGFGDRAEVVDDLREWDYGTDEGRTTATIREERPALARSSEGPVIAFSHGHLSRVLGARWIELPVAEGAHLRLDTAAISMLGWERETPALQLWNDTGRLPRD
jgi:broad specificity phosphatase PhoE